MGITRAGNFLFGFTSKSIVFFERKSDSRVKNSQSLPSLLKKSDRVKSDGSDGLLGITWGKAVKNIRKILIFSSERFARITSETLTLLFTE